MTYNDFRKEFLFIKSKFFKEIGDINFEFDDNLGLFVLGICSGNFDFDSEKIVHNGLKFSPFLLKTNKYFCRAIIKHELIHYEIHTEFKNNTKGVLNIIFPHGISFIKKSIRAKNYIDSLICVLCLGLIGINLKVLRYCNMSF